MPSLLVLNLRVLVLEYFVSDQKHSIPDFNIAISGLLSCLLLGRVGLVLLHLHFISWRA